MKKTITLIAAVSGLALLIGCGKEEETPTPTPPPQTSATTPAAFTTTKPAGTPTPIPEARGKAKPGEQIVLAGKVMGVSSPFVEGRAVFVIGDEATLTSCDMMGEDDHCPTPWDACCDSPKERVAGTATVQIQDASGAVLAQGLKGVGGLKELSQVVVSGKVADNASAEALIVNAESIYVVP